MVQVTIVVNLIAMAMALWLGFYIITRSPRSSISWLAALNLWFTLLLFLRQILDSNPPTRDMLPWLNAVAPLALPTWVHLTARLLWEKTDQSRQSLLHRVNRWGVPLGYGLGLLYMVDRLMIPIPQVDAALSPILFSSWSVPPRPLLIVMVSILTVGALSLVNLWEGRKQIHEPKLSKEFTAFLISTVLSLFGGLYLTLGYLQNWQLPMLPGVVFMGTTVTLLGYIVAKYNALIEGRPVERDVLYTFLGVGLVTALYGLVMLVLHVEGETSFLSLVLIIMCAITTHSLYDGGRAALDRFFYQDRFQSLRANLRELAREAGTGEALSDRLQAILRALCQALQIKRGFILIREENALIVAATTEASWLVDRVLPLTAVNIASIQAQPQAEIAGFWGKGLPILLAADGVLLGVLVVGTREPGQPYREEDREFLGMLADQIAAVIQTARQQEEKARTIDKMVADFRNRERVLQQQVLQLLEAEHQLQVHHRSPLGQAEKTADTLLVQREAAFLTLYDLAQQPGEDANQASLLGSLVPVLESRGEQTIAGLADGFHDIVTSQSDPKKVAVGLDALIGHLKATSAQDWQETAEALAVYSLCQAALEAKAIPELIQLASRLHRIKHLTRASRFAAVADWLAKLAPIVETLDGYVRDILLEDKLAYLAEAIERLEQYRCQRWPSLAIPDQVVFQRVLDHWSALATRELSTLRIRAQLKTSLKTRQVITNEQVTLVLELTNQGRGTACAILVELLPDSDYEVRDGQARIEQLAAGQSTEVSLVARPLVHDHLQARFRIGYEHRQRPEEAQTVETGVQLLPIPLTFRPVPNPYVAGLPLRPNSQVFFGREDVFRFIQAAMPEKANGGCALVLTGQRRMGKTSILQQLSARLGDHYVPIYLDGQSLAIDPGMSSFFYALAEKIATALALPPPAADRFQRQPSHIFEHEFLPKAIAAVGDRHLLFLFDEFEELEMRVKSGKLGAEIFSFLRHLIQHVEPLSFIFVGTHRLEELNPVYWSSFFNIALHRRVSCLDEATARALVTTPVTPHLVYDDLAVDKIIRSTGGHPYFLQLVCHALIFEANWEQRNYVTAIHVNQALEQVLELGEAHLAFVWHYELTAVEKHVLRAVASLVTEGVLPTSERIAVSLRAAGHAEMATELSAVLLALVQREILQPTAGAGGAYRFVLDLLRLWIIRHRE
jgi:hypothetical protein